MEDKKLKQGLLTVVLPSYNEEASVPRAARVITGLLEQEGIVYAYDDIVGIYETKGIRIGFVSVNEVSQGWAVEKYLEQ